MRILRLAGLGAAISAALIFAYSAARDDGRNTPCSPAEREVEERNVAADPEHGEHDGTEQALTEDREDPTDPGNGEIDGVVVDDLSGRTRAGVVVQLFGAADPIRTTSDRDGRFHFDSLLEGSYRMAAEDGASGAQRNVYLDPGATARVVLSLLSKATLEVRLVDPDRRPLAGIQTTISLQAGAETADRVITTDGAGEATVHVVPGDYFVRAEAPNLAHAEEVVTLASGDVWSTELVLSPGAPLELHVFDARGNPLEGVSVGLSGPTAAGSLTDARGLASFGTVPFGSYHLVMSSLGRPEHDLPVEIIESEGSGKRVIEHRYGDRKIHGRLIGADAFEVSEHEIFLIELDDESAPDGLYAGTAYAGEKGEFEFHGLEAKRWRVVAHGGLEPSIHDVDLRGGDAHVELEVKSGPRISGRVPECAELEPGACTIHLVSVEPDEAGERYADSTFVGPKGVFTIRELPDGAYRLAATYAGGGRPMESGELLASSGVTARTGDRDVEVHVEGVARFHGRVRVEGGRRPASITVTAQGREHRFGAGDFTIDQLLPGATYVEVVADGFVATSTTIDIAPNRVGEGVFVLHAARRFTAFVFDAATGAPIDDAVFAMNGVDGRYDSASATSDGSGEVQIDGITVGQYRVEVRHPQHLPASETITFDGSGAPLEIRLERGVAVGGVVKEANGEPARNIDVVLELQSEADYQEPRMATTDADGRFRIAPVRPGAYRIAASSVYDGLGGTLIDVGSRGLSGVMIQLPEVSEVPEPPSEPLMNDIIF